MSDARDIQEEYFEDHIVLAQRARKVEWCHKFAKKRHFCLLVCVSGN
jgi:hypothetical protein